MESDQLLLPTAFHHKAAQHAGEGEGWGLEPREKDLKRRKTAEPQHTHRSTMQRTEKDNRRGGTSCTGDTADPNGVGGSVARREARPSPKGDASAPDKLQTPPSGGAGRCTQARPSGAYKQDVGLKEKQDWEKCVQATSQCPALRKCTLHTYAAPHQPRGGCSMTARRQPQTERNDSDGRRSPHNP